MNEELNSDSERDDTILGRMVLAEDKVRRLTDELLHHRGDSSQIQIHRKAAAAARSTARLYGWLCVVFAVVLALSLLGWVIHAHRLTRSLDQTINEFRSMPEFQRADKERRLLWLTKEAQTLRAELKATETIISNLTASLHAHGSPVEDSGQQRN